ncbi:uncharacterized protein LOC105686467 [Athalia rosae]|uniref:uncharacterized protein LOC105686467 n=1 Tax=Athalia rosae TaxID=37344 RepID=UPI0020349B88|nr:uncharacterized protein LOC105686467 [Athalia rosae]XP_048507936.1 uncharacterized protein LOC105686467 [Athalia rosae]
MCNLMSTLRRLQKMHSVVLLGGIIVCLILMIQVKQIYENNQKHYRFLGYKQYIEEITAEMNVVERSANKSSAYVRQLNEALLKHRDREIKNLSLPRMTLPL